jgi:hypothetical protein
MTGVALKACHQLLQSCTQWQMHLLHLLQLLLLPPQLRLQWQRTRWQVMLQLHQQQKH